LIPCFFEHFISIPDFIWILRAEGEMTREKNKNKNKNKPSTGPGSQAQAWA